MSFVVDEVNYAHRLAGAISHAIGICCRQEIVCHRIRNTQVFMKRTPNKGFDKSKLPSRHVTQGPSRAPHRSYYHAMGMTEEEIERPSSASPPAGKRGCSLQHCSLAPGAIGEEGR